MVGLRPLWHSETRLREKEGSQEGFSETRPQKRPPARPLAAGWRIALCREPMEKLFRISVWLVAGTMLCSIPNGSLEEDVLWILRVDNLRVFSLLRQLQRIPPHLCLGDRNDFKFPWNRGTITQMHKTQRTCFHHATLLQMFTLFTTQRSLAAWDHALLSHLLSSLHHSLEDLEDLEQREGENRACPNVGILIRKYFHRIHNYLREKKYSACAWEVVRVEMTLRVGIMLTILKGKSANSE